MVPTKTLNRFIHAQERNYPQASGELSDLLSAIGLGVKFISRLVASAGVAGLTARSGNVNVQGETTYKLDEEADNILVDILSASGHFGSLVSEERDDVIPISGSHDAAKYVVAFDPLDGSSNIGTNIPVGTIFTIWKRMNQGRPGSLEDFLQKGREIVAAGYSVYGAMTSFVFSCGDGVHGFTLDPQIGEFILTEESIVIPPSGSTYSVNEGYSERWSPELLAFIGDLKSSSNCMKKAYSGRYVGSLVADFDRTLRKGGIFLHPANQTRPRGKLRLLYECMPLAYIVDQAGGRAVDGKQNVLDIMPTSIHERCPFIVGGVDEIRWFEDRMRTAPEITNKL